MSITDAPMKILVPAFVEVSHGEFKPVQECTKADLRRAVRVETEKCHEEISRIQTYRMLIDDMRGRGVTVGDVLVSA